MVSLISSLGKRFMTWFLRRFGDLDRVDTIFRRHGGRYLEVADYAELENISPEEARQRLEEATTLGFFEKKYILESPSLSAPIIVDREDIGKTVPLTDYALAGDVDDEDEDEDEDEEFMEIETITIDPHRVREIFVGKETHQPRKIPA